jgi:predicted nicotinamide N-methyase
MNKDSLHDLLQKAGEKFQVDFEPVKINDISLDILQIQNMDEYLENLANKNSSTDPLELPFWAKIWPASILMSYSLDQLSEDAPEKTVLEIGAGVGLCGLYSAALGFRTTITDNDPDALLFSEINALKNGLADKIEVCYADIKDSGFENRFDYILGSEILYIEKLNRALVEFMSRHLKPGGRIILSADYKRQSEKFFQLAGELFDIQQKTIGYKETNSEGQQEKFLCRIYSLKRKGDD